MVYEGKIDSTSVLRAITAAEQSSEAVHTLRINSDGGDALAGIDFGYWIDRNDLGVVVDELCFSSCANYVFTAATTRRVLSGAIVGWHGGALQEAVKPTLPWYGYLSWRVPEASLEAFRDYWRDAESAFFESIGVDQKITVYGQQAEHECQHETGAQGWAYSVEDLCRMGLKNTVYDDGEPDFTTGRSPIAVCRVTLGNTVPVEKR